MDGGGGHREPARRRLLLSCSVAIAVSTVFVAAVALFNVDEVSTSALTLQAFQLGASALFLAAGILRVTRWRVTTETLDTAAVTKVQNGIAKDFSVPVKDVDIQSIGASWGGEVSKKAWLGLAVLVARRPDLLLLDEPTNHISLALADELEESLGRFPGTVLVASHDRWLRRRWEGDVLSLYGRE